MRLDQMTIEQRGSDPTLGLITGAYGGHTIDFANSPRKELRCSDDCRRSAMAFCILPMIWAETLTTAMQPTAIF